MYLRKNRVRSGNQYRHYLSIAHNVWWQNKSRPGGQSRPVVIASLGSEANVDLDLAQELVSVVERMAFAEGTRRGETHASTQRIAGDIRRIERFLRVMVSPTVQMAARVPEQPMRARVMDSLIRGQLGDPLQTFSEDSMAGAIEAHRNYHTSMQAQAMMPPTYGDQRIQGQSVGYGHVQMAATPQPMVSAASNAWATAYEELT